MLRNKICLIFLISLISNICLADPPASIFLNIKDIAPFSGFLLPKEKLEEFHTMSLELQKEQDINKSLNTSISLLSDNNAKLQEGLNLSIDQNDKLIKKASNSDLEKILYFGGGVIITTLAIFLGSRVTR